MGLKYTEMPIDNETIACEYDIKERNVIILHGAGSSSRGRHYDLAQVILERRLGVILFDFSGHGDSTGSIEHLSLARRVHQAASIIEVLLPSISIFYVIGFSMGAQTACDLLPSYGNRIPAILLGYPGIYDKRAKNIPFGEESFTSILRTENSWLNSNAFSFIHDYKGRTLIGIGDADTVIPKGVIEQIMNNASNKSLRYYPGASHQLAKWLSDNPRELSKIVDDLVNVENSFI